MQNRDVLLSILRALIGRVTLNLRSVYVNEINDIITLIFYYDKQPTEDEIELASLADTEFICDFPSPEYKTDCKVLTLPYPTRIPQKGLCVYERYEE